MVRCRPRQWKQRTYRIFDRFVPTVPFRYLPPKQSVRLAFNVVLDREPDPAGEADYVQKLTDGELSRHGVAEALAHSEEFRRRVPIGNVLLSMHVSRSDFVAGLPPGVAHPRPGRDPPGPARRGAGAPGLPLPVRAPGRGRSARSTSATPSTRGARRASPCCPSSGRWSSPSTPWSTSRATTTARSTWSTAASPLSTSARPTGTPSCGEAFRVLVPGGWFCLDTPNGPVWRLALGRS